MFLTTADRPWRVVVIAILRRSVGCAVATAQPQDDHRGNQADDKYPVHQIKRSQKRFSRCDDDRNGQKDYDVFIAFNSIPKGRSLVAGTPVD